MNVIRWLRGRRHSAGALVQSVATWEAQYAAGRWSFLGGLPELSRYSVLVGYLCALKPGGAVLDVGCGAGVLLERLPSAAYSRYVGVDVSSHAIAMARKLENERTLFLCGDCAQLDLPGRFDAIVFGEVLYCLAAPESTVQRCATYLARDGLMLLSTCTAARGALAQLRRLKRSYVTVDETRVDHVASRLSWICTVLRCG